MRTHSVFQISADPLNFPTVTANAEFVVDVVDNDGTLSDPDADGRSQFDEAGLPGAINSANTQIFELYSGSVGGQPVEFILLRFTAPPLMVVTVGDLSPGQTITGVTLQTFNAPPIDYKEFSTFTCFAQDVGNKTKAGRVRAADLRVGDQVAVLSGGYRPKRDVMRRRFDRAVLRANPRLRPIRIYASALSANMPRKDLLVSPQHRILIRSKIAERVAGARDVLVAANKLTMLPGIYVDEEVTSVEYTHFMFDGHAIVDVEGVPAESLLLGPEARKTLPRDTLEEIYSNFPSLADDKPVRPSD